MGSTPETFPHQRPEWTRFCYPILVATGIRVFGAAWLYQTLTVGGRFHTPWMDANPNLIPANWSWLWLFNAFDSLHFVLIAIHGYSHPEYAYFPAYPTLIYALGSLTGNYWLSAFLITQVFALGSFVAFQRLAEQYMPSSQALYATILMASFPFVSVFTTLGYSEPLFLFSTLSSWYLYKKGKICTSSILAGVASVTRIYGLAIVLPMILDVVKSKQYRRALNLIVPLILVGSWLLFGYLSTGDPFVSWTDQRSWQNGGVGDGLRLIQAVVQYGLRGLMKCCYGMDPTIFWGVGLFMILLAMTWGVDSLLWAYAASLSGLLLITATYDLSLLRFYAFIFPIWLTIRTQNRLIVAISLSILVPMTIVMWLYAIAITFIG